MLHSPWRRTTSIREKPGVKLFDGGSGWTHALTIDWSSTSELVTVTPSDLCRPCSAEFGEISVCRTEPRESRCGAGDASIVVRSRTDDGSVIMARPLGWTKPLEVRIDASVGYAGFTYRGCGRRPFLTSRQNVDNPRLVSLAASAAVSSGSFGRYSGAGSRRRRAPRLIPPSG